MFLVLIAKVSGSYLPFPLCGTQSQIWKSWSRKYYTTIFVNNTTMLQYWVIESFLFWVILVTYNVGIYICIYIYKVSYIHSFFVIFNCNVFSALRAKYFVIWKNIVWNWWVDCFVARSIKWCDISGCSYWIHFLFYGVFFSQENCVSFDFLVTCLSLSQSVWILLVNLLCGFTWKLLLPVQEYYKSHLMNLIQLIDCWKLMANFPEILFYCCKRILIWKKLLEIFWRLYMNIIFLILLWMLTSLVIWNLNIAVSISLKYCYK